MAVPSWAIPTEDEEIPEWAVPTVDEGQISSTSEASKLFPNAIRLDEEAKAQGSIPNPLTSGFAAATDAMDAPTRWAATMRGMDMSDPNAYWLRPEVEAYQQQVDENASPWGLGYAPVMKTAAEIGGRVLSDPMLGMGLAGKGLRALGRGVESVGNRVAGAVKKGVSDLSQIPQEILDRAATKEGFDELSGAAIRTKGGNMMPEAEELAQRVAGINANRNALREGSQARQLTQFEEELSQSLQRPGILTGTPSRGTNITETVSGAKGPMQEAFVEGDKASVGPLRGAGAPEYQVPKKKIVEVPQTGPYGEARPPLLQEETVMVSKKALPRDIANVLSEFKALSPEQGVPKITRGAAGALKSILGMADKQANNIDDLINLKGQLRSVRNSGGFEGNIFDSSVDDLAFAKTEEAINKTIEKAIVKADPKNASKIITLMRANNEQYAKTKEALSGLAGGLGRTENSDRVIAKVAGLGPKKSKELIESAKNIPALRPVVEELRQGLVDDLILSAQKGGSVDPIAFAKRWKDARALSPELKAVWLKPEQIARIDQAVNTALMEFKKPGQVGQKLFGTTVNPAGSTSLAARRLENIGTAANRDAAKELAFLDQILGLKGDQSYLKQAEDVFQARQLGMNAEGRLPVTSMSKTGRSLAGWGWGDIIGGILGGSVGLTFGGLGGGATGAILGAGTKRAVQGAVAFSQSPAGAVAANRIMNKWAIEKAASFSTRAAAIASKLQKANSEAVRARLLVELNREIQKHQGEEE